MGGCFGDSTYEPVHFTVERGAHGSGRKRHKEQYRKRKKREAGKHRVIRIPLSTEYRDQYKKWPIVTPDKVGLSGA